MLFILWSNRSLSFALNSNYPWRLSLNEMGSFQKAFTNFHCFCTLLFHMKQFKKQYFLEQQPAPAPVTVSEGGGELTHIIGWSSEY